MRLSTRITVGVAVLTPVIVLIAGVLLAATTARDLRAAQTSRLVSSEAAVAASAQRYVAAADHARHAQQRVEQQSLSAAALDLGIRLTAPGIDFEAGPQPPDTNTLPTPDQRVTTVTANGVSWHALGRRWTTADGGQATLWVFSSDAPTEAAVRTMIRDAVIAALLTVPVAALVAALGTRRATRSLRALQARTAGLDPADPSTRSVHRHSGVAEVDALAHTVDVVLARYDEQATRTEQALATARSFAAAASHELRNPLMSMGTNLDILADHPDLDAAERAEILAELHEQHRRVLGTLRLLRALAQGDLVEAAQFEPVDLADLAAAAVAAARATHPADAIRLEAADGALLLGWADGLRMVLDNLLSNALVHGRTGRDGGGSGRAEVTLVVRPVVEADGPMIAVTIDDHGPGIDPARRDEVFGLFHRGADSPGSGLGLTLVAQQVALHGGRVRITDPPGQRGGTRVDIRLPATEPSTQPRLPRRRDWLTDTTPLPVPSTDPDPGEAADNGVSASTVPLPIGHLPQSGTATLRLPTGGHNGPG